MLEEAGATAVQAAYKNKALWPGVFVVGDTCQPLDRVTVTIDRDHRNPEKPMAYGACPNSKTLAEMAGPGQLPVLPIKTAAGPAIEVSSQACGGYLNLGTGCPAALSGDRNAPALRRLVPP